MSVERSHGQSPSRTTPARVDRLSARGSAEPSFPIATTIAGDALDLIQSFNPAMPLDLLVTDPPYAFGGSGDEHALSATVAVVLREAAQRLRRGSWAVIFSAASWRSTAYM